MYSEKKTKKEKNEYRHAINPTIVKRSTLIGHLPPEVALCGLAALHQISFNKHTTARKKERAFIKSRMDKVGDQTASERKYPHIPEIKSEKIFKSLQTSEH